MQVEFLNSTFRLNGGCRIQVSDLLLSGDLVAVRNLLEIGQPSREMLQSLFAGEICQLTLLGKWDRGVGYIVGLFGRL